MIMEWKKTAIDKDVVYTATWRGANLLLYQSPIDERWHMTADEKLVKQSWTTARKAMNEVELRQQRLVKEAMKTAPRIAAASAPGGGRASTA